MGSGAHPAEAISFGLSYDSSVVRASTVELPAVWGGHSPGFVSVKLLVSGDADVCAPGTEGVAVGLVGSTEEPSSSAVPPGVDRGVATIRFNAAPNALPGDRSELAFVGCLVPAPGSPPVLISVTCASETRRPTELAGGTVSVVSGGCTRDRGQCNSDEQIDISDAVALFSFLFSGGAAPVCVAACHCNADGVLDISDGICLLSHLFSGGPLAEPRTVACE